MSFSLPKILMRMMTVTAGPVACLQLRMNQANDQGDVAQILCKDHANDHGQQLHHIRLRANPDDGSLAGLGHIADDGSPKRPWHRCIVASVTGEALCEFLPGFSQDEDEDEGDHWLHQVKVYKPPRRTVISWENPVVGDPLEWVFDGDLYKKCKDTADEEMPDMG
jgi:hypothetical protein